jgi:hypothetical protein
MALLTLTMAPDGILQNLALWKSGTKQYIARKDVEPICKPLSYID